MDCIYVSVLTMMESETIITQVPSIKQSNKHIQYINAIRENMRLLLYHYRKLIFRHNF